MLIALDATTQADLATTQIAGRCKLRQLKMQHVTARKVPLSAWGWDTAGAAERNQRLTRHNSAIGTGQKEFQRGPPKRCSKILGSLAETALAALSNCPTFFTNANLQVQS